uniref:Uncharacterized protein n=1 Tax=Craspedostauros australis TaxID=1486917 RepID=A0A7R9X132_9STRA|mmetsp:Transcript_4989/g.13236  ORF Transcript_4989/g.13236 Transcript_4989/m.13236 type:complete len:105 (+) Transcript_4989:239-553(+)
MKVLINEPRWFARTCITFNLHHFQRSSLATCNDHHPGTEGLCCMPDIAICLAWSLSWQRSSSSHTPARSYVSKPFDCPKRRWWVQILVPDSFEYLGVLVEYTLL